MTTVTALLTNKAYGYPTRGARPPEGDDPRVPPPDQQYDRDCGHVSEILTNPIYHGVLRDGCRRAAVIEDTLWAAVGEMRSRHSRRHPGPATYRQYLLSGLMHCRACGRRLTGHVRRYRHIEACDAFRAVRPSGSDPRQRGESYGADVYDRIIPGVLAHVVASATVIAEVEGALGDQRSSEPNYFALARIKRERERATARLTDDRDVAAWQATMTRLDRRGAEAMVVDAPSLTACEIADSLADLAALFLDAEPATQHRIAQALFDRVEVLGPKEIWIYPSVEAEARWLGRRDERGNQR